MMQYLSLEEGDEVRIELKRLRKLNYVKISPKNSAGKTLLDRPDTKALFLFPIQFGTRAAEVHDVNSRQHDPAFLRGRKVFFRDSGDLPVDRQTAGREHSGHGSQSRLLLQRNRQK
ncbi:hypothetical protein MHBO_001196 [Bonamia ostreae]|uniref:Uncharacterized protein n=1 Tax=Bonamia ostreae TaxID=126728 RepID=A0ABV2AI65_9EUKA